MVTTPAPDDPAAPRGPRRGWHLHPGVRSGPALTPGEQAADAMRNRMGSWPFVFSALLFLGIWMLLNGRHGFDPFPFILLNLLLSCLAALQGAILLIAARRTDQISSELAAHDYACNQRAESSIDRVLAELADLREQLAGQPVAPRTTAEPAGRPW